MKKNVQNYFVLQPFLVRGNDPIKPMGNGQNSLLEREFFLLDFHVFDKLYSWKITYLKKKNLEIPSSGSLSTINKQALKKNPSFRIY